MKTKIEKRRAIDNVTKKMIDIPMFTIYWSGMPIACENLLDAVETACDMSSKSYNTDEEFKIFDSLSGVFFCTYINGIMKK